MVKICQWFLPYFQIKRGQRKKKFFKIIREDIKNEPQTYTSDFEKASLNAVAKQFPDCQINLCYFHSTQNLWKNFQQKGLQNSYSDDPLIRKSFKYLKSLVYVPVKFVP